MYNIIYIPTGQHVGFFDPQTLCGTKEYPKLTWGSQHRRPPMFYLFEKPCPEDNVNIPDWIISSILRNKKMYKRLMECHDYDAGKHCNAVIEEFLFIKVD